MTWTRRRFVGTALAASAVGPVLTEASEQKYMLRPAPVRARIAGVEQELLGFNGSWPGPELRARQGDTMRIRLENGLNDGALVHWHGLRVPNRMDGVNVLTQDVIPPGRAFDYHFDVPDAGTYWYHSHYISYDQVSRGLFGPLIVDERELPDVDQGITVQLFDMLVDRDGVFDENDSPGQFTAAGRIGNLAMVLMSTQSVRIGERVRLRLINPSIDRVFDLDIQGFEGAVVALDGMPLAAPRSFDRIVLAPGQRCDVIGDVTADLRFQGADGTDLGSVAARGQRARRTTPIAALPPNTAARPQEPAAHATLVMQGGMGGQPHGGFGTWALNDVSGLPAKPLVKVRRGATARITLRNQTSFDHVMHLHGHHFWELNASGHRGDYRDSTLVRAGEARDILCVLDNPGSWMFHCHMLSHQADGMATWLQVT